MEEEKLRLRYGMVWRARERSWKLGLRIDRQTDRQSEWSGVEWSGWIKVR